jgi:hypothetical protein
MLGKRSWQSWIRLRSLRNIYGIVCGDPPSTSGYVGRITRMCHYFRH